MKILGVILMIIAFAIVGLVVYCLCKAAPDWEEQMEKEENDDEH